MILRGPAKSSDSLRTVLGARASRPLRCSLTSLIIVSFLSSCSTPNPNQTSSTQPTKPSSSGVTTAAQDSIHKIELPHDEADFPPGPGRRLFISRCTICHSLRYIAMQPDFPEKTWIKEVQKMRETWGAHITDGEAKEIISYLVQIKGSKSENEIPFK